MRRSVVPFVLASLVLLSGCGDDAVGDGSAGAGDEVPWGTAFASDDTQVAGTAISLTFHHDERVTANAGCNTIGLDDVSVRDGALHASGGAMTEMGCDPDLHAQDEWLAGFLSSEPAWSLDGDTLVLTSGDEVLTLQGRDIAAPDPDRDGDTSTDGPASG